jgi:hypothetical protein
MNSPPNGVTFIHDDSSFFKPTEMLVSGLRAIHMIRAMLQHNNVAPVDALSTLGSRYSKPGIHSEALTVSAVGHLQVIMI